MVDCSPRNRQGLLQQRAAGSHDLQDRHGEDLQEQDRRGSSEHRQSEGVPHQSPRRLGVTLPYRPRHERRRAVGKKVEQHEREGKDGRVHPQGRQRHRAELPHERGVDE